MTDCEDANLFVASYPGEIRRMQELKLTLEGTRIGVSVNLPPFSCPLIGENGGFRRGEIAVQKNNGKIFAA